MSKSVFVKGSVIAAVIALAFSSVAFAKSRTAKASSTPATSTPMSAQLIQNNWKDELSWLKFDNAVLGRLSRIVDRIAARLDKDLHSKRADDRLSGKLEVTFNEVQLLLGKAQSIASTHAGFDASGNVTDQAQALKSEQQLGAYLDQLRGTFIYRLEHMI